MTPSWPTTAPTHDSRLDVPDLATHDVGKCRRQICEALGTCSAVEIDAISLRLDSNRWGLAVRSSDRPQTWNACTTAAQLRVAVCDRLQIPNPTNSLLLTLTGQSNPLPHLRPVASIVKRPIWDGSEWVGSPEGEYDPGTRTLVCLDEVGQDVRSILVRAATQIEPTRANLQALATMSIDFIGNVCQGAAWAADCDRASWLTGTVAASTRPQWASPDGAPSPMVMLRSPDSGQGGGKSTLAHAIGLIAGGSAPFSTEGIDGAEFQRQLAPLLLDRFPVIVCDEIGSKNQAGVVDTIWHEVMTSTRVAGRVVGGGRITAENHSVFVATGINPQYRGNMRRRVIPARLTGPSDPSGAAARHGVAPLAYCRAHAAELAAAAILVVWAYDQAGRPETECTPARPSYDDFELVRQAVIWAGGGDCYDRSAEELEEDDAAVQAGRILLEQVTDALRAVGSSTIRYRELAPHLGLPATSRSAAMTLSAEIRRMAWPPDRRVAIRLNAAKMNVYLVEARDAATGVWSEWDPQARPLVVASTNEVVPEDESPVDRVVTRDDLVSISVGESFTLPDGTRGTRDAARVMQSIDYVVREIGETKVPVKDSWWICPGYLVSARIGDSRHTYPRRIEDLDEADILGFDFDKGTVGQARAMLDGLRMDYGLAHLVHSSYSHRPKAPRLRVILFPASPLKGGLVYRATWEHWADLFESEWGIVADRAPCHLASVLYYGQPHNSQVPWSDWAGGVDLSTRGAAFFEGLAISCVRPVPRAVESLPSSPGPAFDGRSGLVGVDRAHAYLARVPRTQHTGDFYKLITRVGDLVLTEDDLRSAILAWVARVIPTHSTGEPYTAAEVDKHIACAIKYRQTALGGGL